MLGSGSINRFFTFHHKIGFNDLTGVIADGDGVSFSGV